MRLDDKGRIIAYDKVRGKKNAVARTVETMKRHAQGGVDYAGKAFICHSNCLSDALATKAAVEAAFPHLDGEVRICDIGHDRRLPLRPRDRRRLLLRRRPRPGRRPCLSL